MQSLNNHGTVWSFIDNWEIPENTPKDMIEVADKVVNFLTGPQIPTSPITTGFGWCPVSEKQAFREKKLMIQGFLSFLEKGIPVNLNYIKTNYFNMLVSTMALKNLSEFQVLANQYANLSGYDFKEHEFKAKI